MIGLVIVTHGRLAEEFVSALEHVVGPQTYVKPISIGPDDNMEKRRAEILAAVKAVDLGSGVIIVTDMFGGTPSNLAISAMGKAKVEVIAGVNLPLLIKVVQLRTSRPIDVVVTEAQAAARKYIIVASQELAKGA